MRKFLSAWKTRQAINDVLGMVSIRRPTDLDASKTRNLRSG